MQDQQLPPQEPGPQPDVKQIDPKTVVFITYMLYKLNLITRIQVRDFLDLIKSNKVPADITQFLIDEVKKI
jgi:hypothetical protein